MTLLSIKNLSIEFASASASKRVVHDLSLDIAPGEKLALVGESGSGKSVTAMAILQLSLDARYQGSIQFDGKELLGESLVQLRKHRGNDIAMVFQEPMTALNPLYSVGHQIVEVLELHEGLSKAEAKQRALALLERTGIDDCERRFNSFAHQLSGGQRQRAMIAMALACRPRLLIADEPTTALDVTVQKQIIELLNDLQREFGMAVLLITHDLNLVRAFAERVAVMQDGRIVEHAATTQLFAAPVHEYTRRLIDSQPKRQIVPLPSDAQIRVNAEALQCTYWSRKGWFGKHAFVAVQDAKFELRVGETLGIVGESGSGKSTLGMALFKLSTAQVQGLVTIDSQAIYSLPKESLRAARKNFQVVFQDPFSSLSPRLTVDDIVGEGLALHQPQLSEHERRAQVVGMLEEVGLDDSAMNRYPHEFSGGQRQRIAIARAVILRPSLLLLDEPTSALDVSVQSQVLELLVNLQKKYAMSYIFISHDLAVIRAMSHQVLVMQGGRIVERNETQRLFADPQDAYTRRLLNASL